MFGNFFPDRVFAMRKLHVLANISFECCGSQFKTDGTLNLLYITEFVSWAFKRTVFSTCPLVTSKSTGN